jgi:hypothetical protein
LQLPSRKAGIPRSSSPGGRRQPARRTERTDRRSRGPLIAIIGGLLLVSALGLPYYLLPPEERVRAPLHPWLRPSGYLGQSAGIVALLIFLFLWLYPLRKKYRWLAFTGSMARWLDVHVLVALALPFIAAVHAAWRFEGLIGLGYASMLVVCLSGIAGRYLYVRIPRSQSGLELNAEEAAAQREDLLQTIATRAGLPLEELTMALGPREAPQGHLSVGQAVARLVRDDADRWHAMRRLRKRLLAARTAGAPLNGRTIREVLRLARREMALTQQARILDVTHRLFHYWHVAHRPFAMAALVAVCIHVGVVITTGMTWFW